MFVQLNPEGSSYSESFSTLKFAERVSGIELGAARSSKEGRDVKELMDQVRDHFFVVSFLHVLPTIIIQMKANSMQHLKFSFWIYIFCGIECHMRKWFSWSCEEV